MLHTTTRASKQKMSQVKNNVYDSQREKQVTRFTFSKIRDEFWMSVHASCNPVRPL